MIMQSGRNIMDFLQEYRLSVRKITNKTGKNGCASGFHPKKSVINDSSSIPLLPDHKNGETRFGLL